MGGTIRKLISRCLLIQHQPLIEAAFTPLQWGVGASNGSETVIHMTRALTELHPDWVFAQTDFSNAYNAVYRKRALENVKNILPAIYPWLEAL